jgi:hypothetical protein
MPLVRISKKPGFSFAWQHRGRSACALTSAVWLLAANALAADQIGAPRIQGEHAITCSNTASGASWQIRIDYDKRTVDANPARFSDTQISWHDAKDGGNYWLDRKSGELTVVFASSTAGHFLYDLCALRD